MTLAVTSASSQETAACTGDHLIRLAPGGSSTVPVGSTSQQCPSAERLASVACSTSGLVEVTRSGPGAASTFGTTSVEVLPERGGPSTSMACCGPAQTSRSPSVPTYSCGPLTARLARICLRLISGTHVTRPAPSTARVPEAVARRQCYFITFRYRLG